MNRIKNRSIPKVMLSSLVYILLVQLITFYVFSEKQKARIIIEDLELLIQVNQFDSLAFLSDMNTDPKIIRESLHHRFLDSIQYITICDSTDWLDYRIDSNYLAIRLIEKDDNHLFFKSDTYAGTLYYGESWTNRYIWLLFKWFKINHENTGVS